MTEEQKLLLETIVKELEGKLYTSIVVNKHQEYKQIVIEYAKQNR